MLTPNQIAQINNYLRQRPILKAWVFGSVARGENSEQSDVDILIRPDYSQKLGWGFFSIKYDLEQILGTYVDVVSEGFLKDFARSSARRDRKLIYERKSDLF